MLNLMIFHLSMKPVLHRNMSLKKLSGSFLKKYVNIIKLCVLSDKLKSSRPIS